MTLVEDLEAHFYDTCARRSDFTFSDYWNTTPEPLNVDLTHYSSKRVLAVPNGDDDEHTSFDVLLTAQKKGSQITEVYAAMRRKSHGLCGLSPCHRFGSQPFDAITHISVPRQCPWWAPTTTKVRQPQLHDFTPMHLA